VSGGIPKTYASCWKTPAQHGKTSSIVTVFLTNMKNDFPIYNRLYAEYFAGPGKPNPTRTTIEVGALPTPIAIELKVIVIAVG